MPASQCIVVRADWQRNVQKRPQWGPSAASGQGSFGYCHANASSASGWQCCRDRQNARPLQPAPELRTKVYPPPPTARAAQGTTSAVFFLVSPAHPSRCLTGCCGPVFSRTC
jgi:hypothetical protein